MKADDRIPPGILTVSSCLAEVAPGGWAIEWFKMTDADRIEAATRCGIGEDWLPSVIAWTTDRFDTVIAWPNAFLDLDPAREFRRRFLPDGFRVLQIGLPDRFLTSFLEMSPPPPPQPGYAPVRASGVHTTLLRRSPLVGGDSRGFEVLGYDRLGGGFDSFRCHALDAEFTNLGATFNRWGLIENEADALRCAAYAGGPDVRTCADAWHPWLVVEHP